MQSDSADLLPNRAILLRKVPAATSRKKAVPTRTPALHDGLQQAPSQVLLGGRGLGRSGNNRSSGYSSATQHHNSSNSRANPVGGDKPDAPVPSVLAARNPAAPGLMHLERAKVVQMHAALLSTQGMHGEART
jgi:hypothetical protein